MAKRVRRQADYVRWLIDEGVNDYEELTEAGLMKPPENGFSRQVGQSAVRMGAPLPFRCLGPLLAESHRIDSLARAG